MSHQTFVTHFADAEGHRRYGSRAVEPPADTGHAVRGNLYAVVELLQTDASAPSGPDAPVSLTASSDPDVPRVAEQLLGVLQTTYYTARGAQSKVLTDAIRRMNELLQSINTQRGGAPLYAGVNCAALLNGMVTVASSGPALSLIVTGSIFEQFPSESGDARDLLGLEHEPQVKTYRRQMQGRGVLFLGGRQWLQHIPVRKLLGSVAHAEPNNARDIAAYLSEQSGYANTPGMLVVLESDPGGSAQTVSSSAPTPSNQATPRNRPFGGVGLPTAVHARPPVHTVPAADWPPQAERAVPAQSAAPQNVATPNAPAPNRVEQPTSDPYAEWAAPSAQADYASPPVQSAAPETVALDQQLTDLWEGARTRALGVWGALAAMLPDRNRPPAAANRSHEPVYADASVADASAAAYAQPAGTSETTLPEWEAESSAPSALAESWQKLQSFSPPAPARGGRARFFILLAVAILILVPITVAAVVWQQGASLRAEGDMLVSAAEANLASADAALDLGDKTTARVELTQAQENLSEASALLGNIPAINALQQEIERELQDVLQISPLYGLVEPLVRFPLEASPHRVLIVDQDIYVLDQGRDLVQLFRLDAERQMVSDPEGEIVLRRGDVINGVTVGSLIAITWQDPIPGIEDKSSLLVLDSNNNVFRYNQRVEGATTLAFGEQEAWQAPTQLQNYLGRIYLADSGRGQIYRYDPGQYEAAPQPWLVAPTEQGLAGLQSMVIEGDIWLLFGNGLLLRYNQGQQAPFALENDVGLVSEPVDIFVGDQDSSSIYLADAGQERILIFGKDGSYQRQLQAIEDHPLRDLRGIYVDEVAGTIYILTKSSLFQHPLPQ